MTEKELNILINRIAEEVLFRINQAAPKDEKVEGTIVLVTSYVPSLKTAVETIESLYEKEEYVACDVEFDLIGKQVTLLGESNEAVVLEKVAGSANIVILTPKISLLERIAHGNDDNFTEHAIMRALLWGRNVEVLLDFVPPRFKRNTFFEKIVTVIETLEEMGVKVLSYKCSVAVDEDRLALVTETEVIDAYKAGKEKINCASKAIVTPSAKDKAAELGIIINY